MYKALYRKFRPVNFDDVYGQDSIVKTLKNSIDNSFYSHAYMFFGPRGTGKTSVSKIFARSINCLNPKDGNACGKCDNCKVSFNKECVDIIEIDAASNNGVDEIRELKNKISLVPSQLKYKVYIIDEVHMLSIGAFNALLKTLEEPPEHVIFILATTDPQKVPETIISRCQCFSFKRISEDCIFDNLKNICKKEKISIDEEVLHEIAYVCDGGMRDALGLLDQLHSYNSNKISLDDFAEVNGTITKKEMNDLFINIISNNISVVLDKISFYNQSGKNLITILESFMRFLRSKLVNFYLKNENAECDLNFLQNFVLLINEKLNDIKKSSNPSIYIEMIILEFMNKNNVNSEIVSNITDSVNEDNSLKINAVSTVETDSKPLKNKEKVNVVDAKKIIESNVESSNNSLKIDLEDEIINIDDIINARVNNALVCGNKKLLTEEKMNIEKFKDFVFDQEIGFIASSICDSNIRLVSGDIVVLSYEYDSIVKRNLSIIKKFTKVYNDVLNSHKKLAIISDNQWDEIKNKFLNDKKSGIEYKLIDEPDEIFNIKENSDIINREALDLFGDLVEIN